MGRRALSTRAGRVRGVIVWLAALSAPGLAVAPLEAAPPDVPLVCPLGPDRDPLQRFEYSEPHMGTMFRIVVYAPARVSADAAVGDAFLRIARLDSLLSDYRDDSEVAELAARAGTGDTLRVHRETTQVLLAAVQLARMSGGAFDPTLGPLTRLWRWSARRGELPDSVRLAEARSRVGYEHIAFSWDGGVLLTRAGMGLDLGAIAKGFAADEARHVLSRHGLTRTLVDAGGDIVVGDPPPGEEGWRVLTPTGVPLTLSCEAVATSGDGERWVEIDGVRYAHVVDPRTGLGVVGAPTVTVRARSGATADALASALMVMERASGDALLARSGYASRIEPGGTQ